VLPLLRIVAAHAEIDEARFVTALLPDYLTTLLPYFLTTLLPYYLTTLLPYFLTSLLPYYLGALRQGHRDGQQARRHPHHTLVEPRLRYSILLTGSVWSSVDSLATDT
jgi:hypothetical protein